MAVIPATDAIVHKNVLLDMTSVMREQEKSGLVPVTIARAMNSAGGVWAAAPLYSWSHLWVWRSDLLAAAKLKPPVTLAEVPTLLRSLKAAYPNVSPFGIGLGSDDDSKMFTQSILWSFGASVYDKNGHVVLARWPFAFETGCEPMVGVRYSSIGYFGAIGSNLAGML